MIYCVDTNFLIWGIKKQSSAGQEDMIEKAENFFQQAKKSKIPIVVPSCVVTEMLAVENPTKHMDYVRELNKGFVVANYDLRIATKAAELMYHQIDGFKKYTTEHGLARDKMKLDFIISATAIIHSCDCMYTHDPHIVKICKGHITTSGMPKISPIISIEKPKVIQTGLFGESNNETI